MELFERLGVALAVGLLIGIERGWHQRGRDEGKRFAGLRTFGIISLLGALCGTLSDKLDSDLMLAASFLGFAILVVAAHLLEARKTGDYGSTTSVAALLTFALGAVAALGYLALAAAVAVITTTLLGLKPALHKGLEKLEQHELHAIFKMLLISVVLLPVLPNKAYGPLGIFNPYEIWLMVVLIAGISFVGYFAVKIAGTSRGVTITGLFGGLASSTAVTLSLSKMSRGSHGSANAVLAVGVILASGTMFPRVLIEVLVINAGLVMDVIWPLLIMMVVTYGGALWLFLSSDRSKETEPVKVANPFEIMPALKFAAFLVVVMALAKLGQQWFAEEGLYTVAALSGISDVDAITLSISRMTNEDLSYSVATNGIIIAASVNTLVKGLLVTFIADRAMAWRVMAVLLTAIVAGLAALLLV